MLDGIRAAGTVSYRAFGTPRELERLLADDLAVLLSERFAGEPGAVDWDQIIAYTIAQTAQALGELESDTLLRP